LVPREACSASREISRVATGQRVDKLSFSNGFGLARRVR
jgi:hypothetical protein